MNRLWRRAAPIMVLLCACSRPPAGEANERRRLWYEQTLARSTAAMEARPLTDVRTGRPFHWNDRASATLISFVYTRCPDARMCPLTIARFTALARRLEGDPCCTLLLVTLDPVYDNVERLRRVLPADAPDNLVILTGDPETVDLWLRAFGFSGVPRDRFGRPVSAVSGMSHAMPTLLVDKQGKVRRWWRANRWDIEKMVARMR